VIQIFWRCLIVREEKMTLWEITLCHQIKCDSPNPASISNVSRSMRRSWTSLSVKSGC
jgi:hypothetical protein